MEGVFDRHVDSMMSSTVRVHFGTRQPLVVGLK